MWIYKSNLSYENFKSEYAEKYLAELKVEYERLKAVPIPTLTAEMFGEYERSGNRINYEKQYFLRRTMLRDFALEAWLGGGDAAAHLEEIITAICDEPVWALPAHVGDSGDLSAVIDLFAAETAQSLTEIVSLLKEKLSASIALRAVEEVKKRVLTPFVSRKEKYGWETMNNNWCAVCGGSVGMTAVYLTEDISELRSITAQLRSVFESYMKSFTNDGACLEGLYYWGYGMTYLAAFLDLYRERTGEAFPIDFEKLVKMADFARKCCISDGITVSFSDGSEKDRIYSGLMCKLSEMPEVKSVPKVYIAGFSGDDCGRWCRAVRDIAWTRETADENAEKVSYLPDAQWTVVRGGELSFAIKGGNNNEPHNHNDVGSVIVVKGGHVILCDIGAGEYTREYFSDERYNIFCCSSAGHSVPQINGQLQKSGREYAADGFFAEGNTVCADIGGAYGVDVLKKCIRQIESLEDEIVLTDTYEVSKPIQVRERFVLGKREYISCLKAKGEYKAEINEFEHKTHDGSSVKITTVDFIFEVVKRKEFVLKIK